MNLLPQEHTVLKSKNGLVHVTTHRLRYEDIAMGKATVKSIMLDDLSFSAISYKSKTIYIILGLLMVFISFMCFASGGSNPGASTAGAVSFLFGLIFIALYFITRKQCLSFCSSGGSIDFEIRGMAMSDAINILDEVEKAKNARSDISPDTTAVTADTTAPAIEETFTPPVPDPLQTKIAEINLLRDNGIIDETEHRRKIEELTNN